MFGGHINFSFFPAPEGNNIYANVEFGAGTPTEKIDAFLQHLNQTLRETEKEFKKNGDDVLKIAVTYHNRNATRDREQINYGEQYGAVAIELISTEKREIGNKAFIEAWRKRVQLPAGIENFTITSPRGGPPGKDIDIVFSNTNIRDLKKASLDLQHALSAFAGVSDIKDNTPFAQEQLIYSLTPVGKTIGLTIQSVGRQLRAAFNGEIAQIYHEPNEEIEVTVMLPPKERYSIATLEHLPIVTQGNEVVPLGTVVQLRHHRSPDVLRHTDTKLTTHVTAEVDLNITNANKVISKLDKTTIPSLIEKYNVHVKYEGKAEEQQETFDDMKYGLLLGLSLIYIILAWVFSSYGWPILIMIAIPMGLTGAILGHFFMGLDLTILSLFGLFGLSGIVVNDSIILMNEYRHLRHAGFEVQEAIIEASCRRLRAVALTSLTTIAGLTPLLFERSLQAQFLIPMATSIAFGLAYATILILLVVPAMLSLYEKRRT